MAKAAGKTLDGAALAAAQSDGGKTKRRHAERQNKAAARKSWRTGYALAGWLAWRPCGAAAERCVECNHHAACAAGKRAVLGKQVGGRCAVAAALAGCGPSALAG